MPQRLNGRRLPRPGRDNKDPSDAGGNAHSLTRPQRRVPFYDQSKSVEERQIMKSTFRTNLFAGLTAVTFCLVLMTSNHATAQVILQRGGISPGYYSPYGDGFNTGDRTGYQGGRTYRYRGYSGYERYNGYYSGYGQGPYVYGLQDTYIYPPAATYRQGTFYRGGYTPQFRTYGSPRYSNPSRRYSPYGYGRN